MLHYRVHMDNITVFLLFRVLNMIMLPFHSFHPSVTACLKTYSGRRAIRFWFKTVSLSFPATPHTGYYDHCYVIEAAIRNFDILI